MTATDIMTRYGEVINLHDFDQLAPMIAADCQFWFSSGTYRGLAETRAAFERTWGIIREEHYAIADVAWLVSTGDAAACTYTFSWRGLIDGEPREGRGRGTTVLRREADGWKIVHEHLSPFPA